MDPFLHDFFNAGGQVHIHGLRQRKPKSPYVIYPTHWEFDFVGVEKAKSLALELIESEAGFPHITTEEMAELLQINYRQKFELIRMAHVGGIRKSGIYKIYAPSLQTYLERLLKRERQWYDSKLASLED